MTVHTMLTIAGSDSSGGAGVQADIKTAAAHGVFAMSAITALTAQNTTGVAGAAEVTPDFLIVQIDACVSDIWADAVKTGMLPKACHVIAAADSIRKWQLKNVVVDPVMVATSGAALAENTADALLGELFPLAAVITPNIAEAQVLCRKAGGKGEIQTLSDMENAARTIYSKCGAAVLVKGGHQVMDATGADDYLFDGEAGRWIKGEWVNNPNTHGTGCTLSSAIASNLALGLPLHEAVVQAKKYITRALKAMLDLGKGSGPLWHGVSSR